MLCIINLAEIVLKNVVWETLRNNVQYLQGSTVALMILINVTFQLSTKGIERSTKYNDTC